MAAQRISIFSASGILNDRNWLQDYVNKLVDRIHERCGLRNHNALPRKLPSSRADNEVFEHFDSAPDGSAQVNQNLRGYHRFKTE